MPEPSFCIVRAGAEHIPRLAAQMRQADRRELWAAAGQSPAEALRHSLALSTSAWCVLAGGEPLAMWGVGAAHSLLANTGAPWLLATPRLHSLRRALLRLSRTYVARLQADFPRLQNYVHAQNHAAIRWLVWCGFTLAPKPEPYGKARELFYKFWRNHV